MPTKSYIRVTGTARVSIYISRCLDTHYILVRCDNTAAEWQLTADWGSGQTTDYRRCVPVWAVWGQEGGRIVDNRYQNITLNKSSNKVPQNRYYVEYGFYEWTFKIQSLLDIDIIGTQVLVIYPDNANGVYMFSWLANSGSSYFLSTLGREINWKDIFFTRLTGEFSFKQFRIYNLWAIEEAEVRIIKYPHWWRMSEFNIYVALHIITSQRRDTRKYCNEVLAYARHMQMWLQFKW